MGQRGTKPTDNLANRVSELPRLPKQPPIELGENEYARSAYKRFVPVLERLGHVCILNLPDMLIVCQGYAMARKAWEELEESGRLTTVSAQGGEYESPRFRVWVTANARMEKCPQLVSLQRSEDVGKRPKVSGYAAVYGQRSNPIWDVIEVIEQGAFDDVLDHDVRALINHEGLPLARTKSGTLKIGSDDKGLFFEFEAPNTERGNELVKLIERGDVAECSFAFRLDPSGYRYTEEDGVLIRYISHFAALRDVSLVTYPAYPQTSADVQRSAETAKAPSEEEAKKAADEAKAAALYAEALSR